MRYYFLSELFFGVGTLFFLFALTMILPSLIFEGRRN